MKYAAKTEVPTEKSRAEIEATLVRYGADQFLSGWRDRDAVIGFRKNGRHIRFTLPLPDREDPVFTTYKRGYSKHRRTETEIDKLYGQAVRRCWRALALVIKAKLEAVETGIVTFEDEFMANTVLPDNKTVADWMRPQIEQVYLTGKMPSMLPMLEDHR